MEPEEGPLFVWLHFFDAHWPYIQHEEWSDLTPYDSEIAYVDQQVGLFLSWWDQRFEDSLVVLTADHGEGFGEGGEQTHGFLLHDGTLHVPLILRGNRLPKGKRIATPVSSIDIMPTILDYVQLSPNDQIEGKNLYNGGQQVQNSRKA